MRLIVSGPQVSPVGFSPHRVHSAHKYVAKTYPNQEACNAESDELRWTHTCLALKHLVSLDYDV